jgi:SAM-dependent methyltransferase
MEVTDLNRLLGNVDIYLLDQILKGRFTKEMKILDAGCGEGRNAVYFIPKRVSDLWHRSERSCCQYCRYLSKSLNPNFDAHRFQEGRLEEIPFHDEAFDVVICSAVLHFAENVDNFWQMIAEINRVLRPGGIFWFRMTTGFGGIFEESQDLGNGKFLLPDGSERFLLTQTHVDNLERMGFRHLENPKSVLVHGQRAMGVFVMVKEAGRP